MRVSSPILRYVTSASKKRVWTSTAPGNWELLWGEITDLTVIRKQQRQKGTRGKELELVVP